LDNVVVALALSYLPHILFTRLFLPLSFVGLLTALSTVGASLCRFHSLHSHLKKLHVVVDHNDSSVSALQHLSLPDGSAYLTSDSACFSSDAFYLAPKVPSVAPPTAPVSSSLTSSVSPPRTAPLSPTVRRLFGCSGNMSSVDEEAVLPPPSEDDVVTYTPDEILRLGLTFVLGFSDDKLDRVCRERNLKRFRKAYGSNPVVLAEMYRDLQTTNNSPEARIVATKHPIDRFLLAHN
jgi:hypothetical protein